MKAACQKLRCSLVVVVLGLGSIACSNDEKAATGGEKATTVEETTVEEKAATVEADRARAERIVFTETDLPDLTRSGSDTDDDSDPFKSCYNDNQVLNDLGRGPRAAESTFSDAGENMVRSSVVSLAVSEDDAKAAFAELKRSSFKGCFEEAIRSGFEGAGADTEIANLSVSDLPVDSQADESVGFRVTVDRKTGSRTLSLSFDYVYFRVDRGLAILFAFDARASFPAEERDRLSAILVGRLEKG